MRNFIIALSIFVLSCSFMSFNVPDEQMPNDGEKYTLVVHDSSTNSVTTTTVFSEKLKNEVLTVYMYKNPDARFVSESIDANENTIAVTYRLNDTSTLTIAYSKIKSCGPPDENCCRKCTDGDGSIWTICDDDRGCDPNDIP